MRDSTALGLALVVAAGLGLAACHKDENSGGQVNGKFAEAPNVGADSDVAPNCDPADLNLSDPQTDEKTGIITFTLTNKGAKACGLMGPPVVYYGTEKAPLPIMIQNTMDKVRRVVLKANGGTATFQMTYAVDAKPCQVAKPMTVTVAGRADAPIKVANPPKICGMRLHVTPLTGKVQQH